MADFLEERISEQIRMGASYVDEYEVEIVETSGGQEYRSLVHPFPARRFDISYLLDNDKTYAQMQAIYHRAHGRYAGFRIRCVDEWSSNGRDGTPTAFDQACGYVSTGVYQLRKYYGTDKPAGAAGYPYRVIFKPVAGTVKAAIGAFIIPVGDVSVDTVTGKILIGNRSAPINAINRATSLVNTNDVHPFSVGDYVVFQNVGGTVELNGIRARVSVVNSLDSFTVDLNMTLMSNFSSGGTAQTRPLVSETVTAGFEFDFPVRFNTAMPVGQDFPGHRSVDGIELIELLNP